MIWGCMGYTVTPCLGDGDAILPKCSTHGQSLHHSGSEFAQVLQNEPPILIQTHALPVYQTPRSFVCVCGTFVVDGKGLKICGLSHAYHV